MKLFHGQNIICILLWLVLKIAVMIGCDGNDCVLFVKTFLLETLSSRKYEDIISEIHISFEFVL